ncbi:MAG: MFS transporter [Acetobacteraceae bacterium]|nr:MFS transporter [Acetobacteraceae bacterium]
MQTSEGGAVIKPASRYRWAILVLLFVITTVNYMDRNILGVLKPTIQADLHFSETDFGDIIFFFSIAYAIGYAGMGWFTDKIGVRYGLAAAAVLWCVASTAHGLVTSVTGFILARILLGLGEGGNFPTCIKTVATWFPVRDRAFATGLFNSGSNIGAMIAPLLGALLVYVSGWQAAFYVTGGIGLIWVVFWLAMYRSPAEHPRVTPSELAYIEQDPDVAVQKVPWGKLLAYPGTWVYIVGGVLTNPAWWFYNNWVPSFLNSKFHVSLLAVGLPLVLIYLLTDVGSIAGGWVSSRLIRSGMDVFLARKLALLACALCTLPVFLAPQTDGLWTAVILIGIAMAAHQGFSANLFTLVSDTMPRDAVASAVGLGGGISSIAGAFSAAVIGRVLDATGGNYTFVFFVCASVYVVATVLIHFLLPRNRSSIVAPQVAPAPAH